MKNIVFATLICILSSSCDPVYYSNIYIANKTSYNVVLEYYTSQLVKTDSIESENSILVMTDSNMGVAELPSFEQYDSIFVISKGIILQQYFRNKISTEKSIYNIENWNWVKSGKHNTYTFFITEEDLAIPTETE